MAVEAHWEDTAEGWVVAAEELTAVVAARTVAAHTAVYWVAMAMMVAAAAKEMSVVELETARVATEIGLMVAVEIVAEVAVVLTAHVVKVEVKMEAMVARMEAEREDGEASRGCAWKRAAAAVPPKLLTTKRSPQVAAAAAVSVQRR